MPTLNNPVVTYHGGLLRFELPPEGYISVMSAEEAMRKFEQAGLFVDAKQYSEPMVKLAIYTNLSNGTLRDDGTIEPAHVSEPVWLVAFTNYPAHASAQEARSPAGRLSLRSQR